jgi:hypothetical protein
MKTTRIYQVSMNITMPLMYIIIHRIGIKRFIDLVLYLSCLIIL